MFDLGGNVLILTRVEHVVTNLKEFATQISKSSVYDLVMIVPEKTIVSRIVYLRFVNWALDFVL